MTSHEINTLAEEIRRKENVRKVNDISIMYHGRGSQVSMLNNLIGRVDKIFQIY